jgi:hypothetical protein
MVTSQLGARMPRLTQLVVLPEALGNWIRWLPVFLQIPRILATLQQGSGRKVAMSAEAYNVRGFVCREHQTLERAS